MVSVTKEYTCEERMYQGTISVNFSSPIYSCVIFHIFLNLSGIHFRTYKCVSGDNNANFRGLF